jgi:carboxylesterase
MPNLVMPTAEPFLLPAGETGVLLLHGFTGSPFEMREMGDYLCGQGLSVLAPRLAGHATRVEDMDGIRWRHWLASVEDGFHLLHGLCPRVYVMGLSMGAMLTLLAASRYPVAGAVAMAAPYSLEDDWRAKLAPLFVRVVRRLAKDPPDWHDPSLAANHVEYPYNPPRAAYELIKMGREMRAALPEVRVPVLLIQSRGDRVIPADSAERIYAALGSTDKSLLWVEDSGHVVTRDNERDKVFRAAAEFIRQHEAG